MHVFNSLFFVVFNFSYNLSQYRYQYHWVIKMLLTSKRIHIIYEVTIACTLTRLMIYYYYL